MTRHALFLKSVIAVGLACLAQSAARGQELLGPAMNIHVSGLPGPLVLSGDAVPLLVGPIDKTRAVAAARSGLGKGALIAFGHESFLNPKPDQPQARAFLIELLKSLPKGAIGVDRGFDELATLARDAGRAVVVIDADSPPNSTADVVAAFVETRRITPGSRDAWRAFVERGGTLACGMPGWGWAQTHPGKSLAADFVPAALYARAGIHWTTDTFDNGPDFTAPPADDLLNATFNATAAADVLFAKTPTPEAQQIAASNQLQFALDALPEDDALRRQVETKLAAIDIRWPTAQRPLTRKDAIDRLAILNQLRRQAALPANQVKPNPAAADFPGSVPADAPRVTRTFDVDASTSGWFVPGLYAAPGEIVTVTVDGDVADFKVRVGSTTCDITRHDQWTRAPRIDRVWPLKPGTQTIASSFGGTIYIDVPRNATGTRKITIANAVEQPVFRLGKDTDDSWKRLRTLPAPWAELICDGIAISLPSKHIRALDNPTELMKWWQHVLDVQDALSPRPGHPKRGERITLDRQICAGYMHSGYPVMCGLDVADEFVNLDSLKTRGNWGIYHELGHNHQWPDWTFSGTGEVTNNLFSLYCYATLNPGAKNHGAMSPESIAKAMKKFWHPDGPADQYQKDPFYALMMYQQIIDRFGFEPFQRFFARAAARAEDERPKTDEQKRDRWLIDLSTETKTNLEPLFTSWGVVTSDEAKRAVANLPKFEVKGTP